MTAELEQALRQIKFGKMADADEIEPHQLKHLPPFAKAEFLTILNYCRMNRWCLQPWCSAAIILILREKKDQADVGSDHPTVQTFTVAKQHERMTVDMSASANGRHVDRHQPPPISPRSSVTTCCHLTANTLLPTSSTIAECKIARGVHVCRRNADARCPALCGVVGGMVL